MKYIVASFLLLLLSLVGLHKPIYKYLDFFFSPLQFGLNITANNFKDFGSFYSNLSSIRRDNIRLLEDNLILESRVVELKRLEEENGLLRSQLGLKNAGRIQDKPMILANVMGNPADLTTATVVVDKGSHDNITVGNNVILGNYVIGKVKEVSNIKSIVELITSPSLTITAYNIDSSSRTEGITAGKHGSSVVIEKVLPAERLRVGDMLVTSGKDGVFIPGLFIGKVSEVYEDPSQPLKSASLQTVLNSNRLDKVFILIDK